MNILILGDSIAAGYWDTEGGGWAGRLRACTDQLTISSNFKNYYSIYNLSISGDTSRGILNRFETETNHRIDLQDDNVVIFAFGINDSQVELKTKHNEVPIEEFKNNILSLIKLSKKLTFLPFFIGLTPVDETSVYPMSWKPTHGYRQSEVDRYNQAIAQVCALNTISFLDLLSEIDSVRFQNNLIDGVHPNSEGHEIIYQIIREYFENNDVIKA